MAFELLSTNLASVRLAAAFLTSFAAILLIGPTGIKILRSVARERIVSDSDRLNQLHAAKKDTPTMGGLLILAAVLFSTGLWCDWTNHQFLIATFCASGLCGIGSIDDWVKARHRRQGLAPRTKFVAQWCICLLAGWLLYVDSDSSLNEFSLNLPGHRLVHTIWPTVKTAWPLGIGMIPWIALVLVATSNAVNLTDGLDGLATGVCLPVGLVFTGLLWISSTANAVELIGLQPQPEAMDVATMLAAVCGALSGFLWFNGYPALVFMGDAGSLAIGGWLGMGAVICRQELLLPVVGGVLVAETLSVILQVAGFKLTGRRLIRCSPLHNHFVFGGTPENRIVVRFWIASAGLCVVGTMVSVVF